MWVSSPVTGPTRLTHPSSPSPCNLHSPVLAAYCRLPRFLKGERGLFLAPVAAPGGRLEDMLWVPGCVVQAVKGKGELSPSCRGLSVRELTRRKERRGRRCSTYAGCLRRYDCSQRKCVYLCVFVCVCVSVCYVCATSRLVGPACITMQRNKPRPLRKALVRELQRWWRLRGGTHTYTRQPAVLLLPWQPQIMSNSETSCVLLKNVPEK